MPSGNLDDYGDYEISSNDAEGWEERMFDDIDKQGGTLGCLFPSCCLMPGEHLIDECHTSEMIFDLERETNFTEHE